jgi:hypothetical protein
MLSKLWCVQMATISVFSGSQSPKFPAVSRADQVPITMYIY